MSRGAAAGLALVAAVIGTAWAIGGRSPQRPSILLVTIDTLRVDRVGAYGARGVRTPALDGIAAGGIRFDAAYTTAPLTLPAHVSMLSGLLPIAHSVRTNDGYGVPEDVPLVAARLREHGYRTAAFVGAVVLRRDTGIARGFELFDDEMGTGAERRADAVVQSAVRWLRSIDRAPTFAWVHLYDPHLPYDPPAPYATAGREYEGEIEYADAAIGTLVEEAEARAGHGGLAVIVAADHGEGLGDHGERSHGALLYDETIRVPLMVKLAGGERRGTVEARPVTTAGIAAAILQLGGVHASGLAASILKPSGDPAVAESLYLHQQLGWSALYAMRDGTRKAIDAPTPELYDLADDRAERRNLFPGDPAGARDALARLRRELAAASRAAAAPAAAAADPEAARQLAALGYVSGGAVARGVAPVGGDNPVERMPIWLDVESGLERSHAGANDEASAIFERVLAADPDNVLALKFLGAFAIERGDLQRGIGLTERVLESGLHEADARKNLMLAYSQLGVGLARAGRNAAAIAAYRRIVALDGSNLDARERLAALLHRAGSRGEAREQFSFVLAHEPKRRGAALGLAVLWLEDGRADEAVRLLEPLTTGWEGAAQAQEYLREARRRLASR